MRITLLPVGTVIITASLIRNPIELGYISVNYFHMLIFLAFSLIGGKCKILWEGFYRDATPYSFAYILNLYMNTDLWIIKLSLADWTRGLDFIWIYWT
jgi:hypothetical protein